MSRGAGSAPSLRGQPPRADVCGGLGKGLPALLCQRLSPLRGGMESSPETPAEVLGPSNPQHWAGSLHPPGAEMLLWGPRLSRSLCAESPVGSVPCSRGWGCCGGWGAPAPLGHGVPSHSTGLCCLRRSQRSHPAGWDLFWEQKEGQQRATGGCGERGPARGLHIPGGLQRAAVLGAVRHDGGCFGHGPCPRPRNTSPAWGPGPPAVTEGSRRGCGSGQLWFPVLGIPGGAETTTLALQIRHLYFSFS